MKTSKIKQVVNKKDFTNSHGTIIYHLLLMENGDKIEIGKKKLQVVGWELDYEVTDDGFEYQKAKSVQKQDMPQTSSTEVKSTQSGGGLNPQFRQPDVLTMIECIGHACVAAQQSSVGLYAENVIAMAEEFYKAANSKKVA